MHKGAQPIKEVGHIFALEFIKLKLIGKFLPVYFHGHSPRPIGCQRVRLIFLLNGMFCIEGSCNRVLNNKFLLVLSEIKVLF